MKLKAGIFAFGLVAIMLLSMASISVGSSAQPSTATNSSTVSKIATFSTTATDSNGNSIYLYVDVYYDSSSNGLTYTSTQQISSAPGTSWEIAGGLGIKGASAPTYSVESSILDPAYSYSAPSPSNPTSSWAFPSNGFIPVDQPNNEISWGQSTSVTVYSGVTVGATAGSSSGATQVGAQLSYTYSVSTTYTESAFLMEPIYQGAYNDSWYFSDNEGVYSIPYSATSMQSSSIYAVQGAYNHVWVRDWAHFVKFSHTWWGGTTPTYSLVYVGLGGVTTPIIN